MSSLRNAVKRITHKERSQPQARVHLGILEKKKDYVARAKDYHSKEDRLNAMRLKASMRNPEEFYFGMNNAEVRDGKHRKTKEFERRRLEEEVGPETLRIMKDQDLGYIRMQKQKDLKKVEKLRSSLHLMDAAPDQRKHTVFVNDEDAAKEFNAASHFDTLPELVGRAYNRPRLETLKTAALESSVHDPDSKNKKHELSRKDLAFQAREARKIAKKLATAKDSAYKEMRAREKRAASMGRAEAHLVTEKLVASKGRKRKIKEAENGQPAQYKWRRLRSK